MLLPFSVSPTVASLITFSIAVLCFVRSVNGDFVFDDSEAIVNNQDLRPSTDIKNLFFNDFWGTKLTHSTSHKSYRPFTILTFRLNYWICGGLHPFSFHLINIILHGLASVLVFHFLSSIYAAATDGSHGSQPAFLSALLFAVHPIHTESVAGVVGRADLLSAIFFLLSFMAYRHACLKGVQGNAIPTEFSYAWIVLSLLLAGASMLSKEQGITVIGFCSAYDVLLLCRIDILELAKRCFRKNDFTLSMLSRDLDQKWIWPLVVRHMILLIGGVSLLLGRLHMMGSKPPSFQPVDNPASFEESSLFRALNYQYIYALNVWLFLQPWWLCFDWSMGCVPLIKTISDIRILAIFSLWLSMGALLYVCLLHIDKRLKRSLSISVALVVIPFLPASNLFFRVGFVIAERVLYLPSIGFCCIIVIGLHQICSSTSYQQLTQVSFLALIVLYGIRSAQRCEEWKTEEILFNSGLKVCPLNAKVRYNIAKNSADRGLRDEAISGYREAIKLNPEYDQAMNNLANILKDLGNLPEAESLLIRALQIRPDFAAAWMNLGIVQAGMHKSEEAETSYRTAIKYRKHYPDCYYNLGNLYLEQKRYEEAYRAWRNATNMRPTQLVAWNNMIVMLDSIGELEKAEIVAHEALQIMPNEATLHFNLANTLGKLAKYEESEKHFVEAILLNSNNPMYFTNLGVLYHLWGKYDKAEQAYFAALKVKPDMKRAYENLELLRIARNKQQVADALTHIQ